MQMENNKQVTYDDMVQTRNIKMLKSIVPFLDFRSQKPAALLIQYLEFKNADSAFSRPDNSMAVCSLPEGSDRRNAMLGAIRQYCTPREQEAIDTILNFFMVMENYDLFSSK